MRLWQLHNFTPFPVVSQFEKDHHAASFWGVWAKATFDIGADGRLRLAVEQDPLHPAPIMSDTGPFALADTDLTLPKSATDILVEADSKPPRRHDPTTPYDVKVSLGNWVKSLTVHPSREWKKPRLMGTGISILGDTDPSIPLSYDQGYGGTVLIDNEPHRFEANPAGLGYHPDPKAPRYGPRLTYADDDWLGPKSTPRPAGFGPIARQWLPRAELAGTFDTDWMQLRAPLMPKDHNTEWRHAAPTDQRYDGLVQGGETVRFNNVKDAIDFTLPQISFHVESHFRGKWIVHDMQVQTVTLRPTQGQVTMCWCGILPIGAAAFDVALRETQVSISKSSGFSVDAQQAARFHEKEAS